MGLRYSVPKARASMRPKVALRGNLLVGRPSSTEVPSHGAKLWTGSKKAATRISYIYPIPLSHHQK